jgi:gliding motility-associated-like protein
LTAGLTLQKFSVYNRWGEEVFETSDIDAGWDGKYNGKPQPMGTYVYYVEFLKQGQTQSIVIKGDVTLIR